MNSPHFFIMEPREEPASPSMLMACAPPIREPAILDLNRIDEYKGVIYIMLQKKGRKWMDFVTPRDSSAPLVCSLRVVQALAEAGLTGYRAYPVEFLSDPGKKLESPCPYYMIIPTGACYRSRTKYYLGSQRDHQYVFLDESPDEPRFRTTADFKDSIYSKRIPRPETWDGSDFNRWTANQPVGGYGIALCSRRVVDLAARDKWTNVMFQPVDAIDNYVPKHLKEPWPPASFYSEFEPE